MPIKEPIEKLFKLHSISEAEFQRLASPHTEQRRLIISHAREHGVKVLFFSTATSTYGELLLRSGSSENVSGFFFVMDFTDATLKFIAPFGGSMKDRKQQSLNECDNLGRGDPNRDSGTSPPDLNQLHPVSRHDTVPGGSATQDRSHPVTARLNGVDPVVAGIIERVFVPALLKRYIAKLTAPKEA